MKTHLRALLAAIASLSLMSGCASGNGPKPAIDIAVQRLVSEDNYVRIDELRVGGQTQRLAVTPKGSTAPGYEILPTSPGHDPSQNRDAAGQRVWPVLSF